MARREVCLPTRFEVDGRLFGNRIRQVARTAWRGEAEVTEDAPHRLRLEIEGQPPISVTTRPAPVDEEAPAFMLRARSLEALANPEAAAACSWQRPGHLDPATAPVGRMQEICENVRASWTGRFHFRQENQEAGTPGLRSPQVGALHNTLGHWTVSDAPATVAMPTGTGKTETMLALLVNQRFPRLLVMVPAVTLRDQLSLKFLTLGVLKRHEIVDDEALYPVVGILQHRPKSVEEVDALFERCNVIVTNMHVAGGCPPFLQERMIERCSHLFIDEAHHVPAKTWNAFRRRMLSKIIVQFTATPFRTDGRLVEDGQLGPATSQPLHRRGRDGAHATVLHGPGSGLSCPSPGCGSGDTDGDRASQLQHTVERMDGDVHLGRPSPITCLNLPMAASARARLV
jgi:hypothetical protein